MEKDNNIIELKKTVQKTVTIINQKNNNYVISLIPIKSATESGNIIFHHLFDKFLIMQQLI